jgi:hypothetical protein
MQPHTISHTGREPTAEKILETRRDRSCHAVTARRRKKTNKDMGLVAQPAEDVANSYTHTHIEAMGKNANIHHVFKLELDAECFCSRRGCDSMRSSKLWAQHSQKLDFKNLIHIFGCQEQIVKIKL